MGSRRAGAVLSRHSKVASDHADVAPVIGEKLSSIFLREAMRPFWGSARLVGAGRDSGDETSAGCVIVVTTFESSAVIAGLNDVAVVGQREPHRTPHCPDGHVYLGARAAARAADLQTPFFAPAAC